MKSLVKVAVQAMATRFEIALWGGSETYLRAVGEEALAEILRLEAQLSPYRSDSDIADLNARAAIEPVRLEPRLFALLERAAALTQRTGGAFDLTVASLLRVWGFTGGGGHLPDPAALAAARECTGMPLVALDAAAQTLRFLREGVRLDMGAFGKGYAIEQAAELLQEYGIGGALLHGGTSTAQAIGTQPDGTPWRIAVQDPTRTDAYLTTVPLEDAALSVSAVHGKSFTEGDTRYGHVLDPRTGQPVQNALLSAVVSASATDSDALSTALLVLGESFLPPAAQEGVTGELVVLPDGTVHRRGVSFQPPEA